MRSLLDHQADGIEYTLHSHGIEASVEGGNISPRLVQFHIRLGAGVKFSRLASLSEELALALGVTHCRITRDGYLVKLEVPRPDPVAVQLFPLMRGMPGDLPELAPILGLDENGVPLLLKLSSPDIAHILITGTTGSGKTTLMRSMVASLALQNSSDQLRLMLIDPKRRGLAHFNGLPNLVCPVITDPLDALHRLKWAVRHMEKRDETNINVPMLVIVIDELAELVLANGREFEQLVGRLTQRGREAGIHLIASTQKATVNAIGTIARSNFPTRIVGRVMSLEDARAATGVNGSGAEKLMGQGDFLLYARDQVTRLQAAHLSQEEMVQSVIHLGGQPDSYSYRPVQSPIAEPERQPERQTYQRPEYQPQSTRNYTGLAKRNRYSDDYEDEQGMGVAERLARYEESIQDSRRSRYTEQVQVVETEEAYQPEPIRRNNKARPEPERNFAPAAEDYEPVRRSKVRPEPERNPVPVVLQPQPEPISLDEPDFDYDDSDFMQDYEPPAPEPVKPAPKPIETPMRPVASQSKPQIKNSGGSLGGKSANNSPTPAPIRKVTSRQNDFGQDDLWDEPRKPNQPSTNNRPSPVKPVAKVEPQTQQQPNRVATKTQVQPSKPVTPASRTFNPVPKPRTSGGEVRSDRDDDFNDYNDDYSSDFDDLSPNNISDLTSDGGKRLMDTLRNRADGTTSR